MSHRDDRHMQELQRLEEAQRKAYEHIERQRQNMDKRFERVRERLERRANEHSDTQRRIVEAALELLKDGGLEMLSQRKLASMLHIQAPALYWHFKNKEELVDYMAEAILQKEFPVIEPRHNDQRWQDWLTNHMMRLRKAMLAYPDGARVVAGAHLHPARTLAQSMEVSLASLHSAGIDLRLAGRIITTATTYTFGYVIEEQSAPTAEQMEGFDVAAFLKPYPHLADSIHGEDWSRHGQDVDYTAGLELIIRGAMTTGDTSD